MDDRHRLIVFSALVVVVVLLAVTLGVLLGRGGGDYGDELEPEEE